jgi:hypothetical protein
MLHHCGLQGMQLTVRAQALDRGDFGALTLNSQRKTGKDSLAITQQSASAASALVASFLRSGQLEMLS